MKILIVISLILISLIHSFAFSQGDISKIDSLQKNIETQSGLDKAENQRLLSIQYYRNSNYHLALDYALKALSYFEKNQLDSLTSNAHLILGAIYNRIKKYERAEHHNLIALENFKKYKSNNGILSMYINLAVLYDDDQQFDNSVKYSLLALEKAKELNDTMNIMKVYSNTSYFYLKRGLHDKSIKMIENGLRYVAPLSEELKFVKGKNELNINLAENYIKLKKFDLAIVVLEELLYYKNLMTLDDLRDIYGMLAIGFEKNQKYKKSLAYYQLEKVFNDSLNYEINNELLMELTVQNEIKYKEQENELLKVNKEVADLKLIDQQNKNNFMLLGLVTVVILLFTFIFNYFKTLKKNKQLVESNLEMLSKHKEDLYNLSLNTKSINKTSESKSTEISVDQKHEIISKLNQALNVEEMYRDQSLTLNSLAKSVNTNRNYLSIVIKELNSTGFLDFINEYRIRKSWSLFSNPENFNLTIDHISKEVGFKSQPTFNKAFKKFTGVAPSFYLREVKNKLKKDRSPL